MKIKLLNIFFIIICFFHPKSDSLSSNYLLSSNSQKKKDKDLYQRYSLFERKPTRDLILENPNESLNKKDVRGIYLNLYATSGKRLEEAISLTEKTEINTFVIDIKNEYGKLLFKSKAASKYIPGASKKARYKDLRKLSSNLKERGIYTIARIVVFKDNLFAKKYPKLSIQRKDKTSYKGRDKMLWIDPHSQFFWAYILDLSNEVLDLGFDEIQFDYVRFPDSKQ